MFESLDDLMNRLKATGYFIDPVMSRIVFLAAKLQKPLLLEGPAGSGKTQLAVSVAQAAGIRALVGDENVGCAVLENSHAPEAFRIEPFFLPSGDFAAKTPLPIRPAARQIRPPETVSVTFRNGSLETFFFRGRRYAIERSYGPWLSGGDWWN
jgi:hypothetical protein